MKALLMVVGILAVAATAKAETFRRAGTACNTKATTYSWSGFGLGIKNTAATGSISVVCPLDAIGEDASNLTHVKVRFQVPAGSSAPQCIFAGHDWKGQAIFKFILNAPVALDGFPLIDFGATHVDATPPTTTAAMTCSIPAGETLLYYTYEDQ